MREINSLKVQKIYEKVAIMVGGRSSIAIKDCGNPMTSKMVDWKNPNRSHQFWSQWIATILLKIKRDKEG